MIIKQIYVSSNDDKIKLVLNININMLSDNTESNLCFYFIINFINFYFTGKIKLI